MATSLSSQKFNKFIKKEKFDIPEVDSESDALESLFNLIVAVNDRYKKEGEDHGR